MIRSRQIFVPVAAATALFIAGLWLAGCAGKKQGVETMPTAEYPADCDWVADGPLTVVDDLSSRLAAYADTEIAPDISFLDATQREVLQKLVAASRIMNDLFWIQACPCPAQLVDRLGTLPAAERTPVEAYHAINYGPWDRRFDREPFVGTWEHPPGANYYPRDLSAAEKQRIEAGEDRLSELTTMVRRDAAGQLVAVPYSVFFARQLQEAAQLLRDAADLTENASLRDFLRSRAAAFLSDDYFESDMLWMDLDSPLEITIGPYETYEDGLFGFKAAWESFVTVTDPEESARLDKFKKELPWLESQLPIPDEHKNPNRGGESPIRVVDEVYTAGDTRAGIQTIAFNLPNDERVREAKGSKKVLLRNVMNAKFELILTPIATELVASDQLDDLTAESFFLHTLWHEMSHGLGPGKIVKDGRETEVRLELKEYYSILEEAKADAMGEWTILVLHAAGRDYFPAAIVDQQAATYLAGLFRSVRFGIAEAHGAANAIQFNYLLERGAISFDDGSGRFRVDIERFPVAMEEMVRDICLLQADGDYEGTARFIQRYRHSPPVLDAALARLDQIPVDIRPVFSHFPD